jgi:TetR/AcrR family transcriptional repressor of nem operon
MSLFETDRSLLESDSGKLSLGSYFLLAEGTDVMSKGERTRQEIIEKAAPLFNQHGFAGCSMGDIMAATGLEKGGLYRHFPSKEALAAEAFRHALSESIRLRTQPLVEGTSALKMLRTYVERFVTAPPGVAGGCPLMNAAVEHDDGNAALRALVRDALGDWHKRLTAIVQQGKRMGEIRRNVEAEWLADTIIATLEGSLMMSRIQRSLQPLRHAQRSLSIILDSVAP